MAVRDNSQTETYTDPEPEQPKKKKGCFGAVEASIIGVSALGILAIGALLADRKRKIAR